MANHRINFLARLVLGSGLAVALGGALAASEPAHPLKPAAQSRPAQVSAPAPLSETELALATQVAVGKIPCELGQTVSLQADAAAPGYFHLQLKDQRFHLRPVQSATGALRLEDASRGAVWIQLASKSMLMDQKQGRRLADECMSALQQAYAEQLKHNPAPNLLDVAQKSR